MIQVRCICDISRLQDLLTVPESHMAKRIRNQGKKCVTLNKIYVTNPRLDILDRNARSSSLSHTLEYEAGRNRPRAHRL